MEQAPDISTYQRATQKRFQPQRVLLALLALLVVALGAAWYAQARMGTDAGTLVAGEIDDMWQSDTANYKVTVPAGFAVTTDQDVWQGRKQDGALSYLIEITKVSADDSLTGGTAVTFLGTDGSKVESKETLKDGETEYDRFKQTAQIASDDVYFQVTEVVKGDVGSLTDTVLASARAEFTAFLAGITKQ